MLAVLHRAARQSGVPLDPAAPPGEGQTQELTGALVGILLTEGGFDGEWATTPFGDQVESLIDGLHRYAYPNEH